MTLARGAWVLAALAGCGSGDLCDGQPDVCVVATVQGNANVDQLTFDAEGKTRDALAQPSPIALPTHVALLFGAGPRMITVSLEGKLGGHPIARDTEQVVLPSSGHGGATFTLDENTTDASAADAAFDLAPAPDASAPLDQGAPLDQSAPLDFSAPLDLSPPLDFSAPPDLTPPPFCQTVTVSTLAGNGGSGFVDGSGGAAGSAQFNVPFSVAVDGAGLVYVADQGNNSIRKVATDGTTSTLAGNGTPGFVDGTGGKSGTTEFSSPSGVAVDGAGIVYVGDFTNQRIRKVAADGSTTTLAGNGTPSFFDGTGGPSGTTEFTNPVGVTVDASGNLYVAAQGNERIRLVSTANGSTTTLAGNGTPGFFDGTGGASGTTEFKNPGGVAFAAGFVYVADPDNDRIRKVVTPGGATSTLAGNGVAAFQDGQGTGAEFNIPSGVTVDGAGNVYVADSMNNRIRRVAPDGTTITVGGGSTASFMEGAGCSARFNKPLSVVISGKLLLVADSGNNRIRKIQLP